MNSRFSRFSRWNFQIPGGFQVFQVFQGPDYHDGGIGGTSDTQVNGGGVATNGNLNSGTIAVCGHGNGIGYPPLST